MLGDPDRFTGEAKPSRPPTPEEMTGFFHAFDVMEETLSHEPHCKIALQRLRNKRELLTSQKEKYDAQTTAETTVRPLRLGCTCGDCRDVPLPSPTYGSGGWVEINGRHYWVTGLTRVFNPGPVRTAGPFRAAFDRVRDRRKGGSKWLKPVLHAAILLSGWALLALYATFPRASEPAYEEPQSMTTVPWPGIED